MVYIAVATLVVTTVITTAHVFATEDLLSPTPAPIPPPSVRFVDVNPYGANFFLEWEPEEWKIDKTFEMAKAAGIHWVKEQFPWDSLQLSPGPAGYWDERLNYSTWDKYDRIVSLADKYGLEVIARLDRPPAWTRAGDGPPEQPPDDYTTYGEFVFDVVSHFRGRIHYYQIWNEPNIYPEWGDQPPDPAAYVRLLKIAYQRAKEADPNVVILSAPLAQTLDNSPRNESDLQYLEGMYLAGAKPYFDILFANAYGFAFPPNDPPRTDRLNFQRVTLTRQIMERNGDAEKPVWFNEFGWNAAPDTFSPLDLPWARVTEQAQAQYTVEAIQYARSHWNWAGVFNIWYFRQPGDIFREDRADYYFRMVDPRFTPRPLYNAVKQATSATYVASPGTYAVTDPSAANSGSWSPTLAPAAIGGVMLSSSNAGDSITVTFRGGRFNLYVRRAPNAGQLYLTVDGREANLIRDTAQGRSVLNLSGSTQEAPIMVPVADRLGPGSHVVRLVVGPSSGPIHGPIDIAGFEVLPVDRFAAILRIAGVVIAAVVLSTVILLVLRARGRRRIDASLAN
jgi:hypothetical protein